MQPHDAGVRTRCPSAVASGADDRNGDGGQGGICTLSVVMTGALQARWLVSGRPTQMENSCAPVLPRVSRSPELRGLLSSSRTLEINWSGIRVLPPVSQAPRACGLLSSSYPMVEKWLRGAELHRRGVAYETRRVSGPPRDWLILKVGADYGCCPRHLRIGNAAFCC